VHQVGDQTKVILLIKKMKQVVFNYILLIYFAKMPVLKPVASDKLLLVFFVGGGGGVGKGLQ
jgi:hypothetical protein